MFDTKPKMINAFQKEVFQVPTNKLIEFRNRYSKDNYSLKVGQNIIYPYYTLAHLFSTKGHYKFFNKSHNDPEEALNTVFEKLLLYRMDNVYQSLGSLWENNIDAGPIKILELKKDVKLAANRDNAAVERLEYNYCYVNFMNILFNAWFAGGLLGYSMEESLISLTSAYFGSIDFNSFIDIYNKLRVAEKNQVVLNYKQLPDLW